MSEEEDKDTRLSYLMSEADEGGNRKPNYKSHYSRVREDSMMKSINEQNAIQKSGSMEDLDPHFG